MDIYYRKIRKKSITSILLGIGMIGVSIYGITEFTAGSGASAEDQTAMLMLFGAFMLMGIFLLYVSARSVHILKKNMEQLGVSEEEVAGDLAKGQDYAACNVGKNYALRCTGRPDVIVLNGALVVYPEIQVTKKNGYRNYTYRVFVTEHSGKEKYVDAKNQDEMEQIYNSILKIVPYVITENDSVVKELRKKNLSELVHIVEKRKEIYEAQSANA